MTSAQVGYSLLSSKREELPPHCPPGMIAGLCWPPTRIWEPQCEKLGGKDKIPARNHCKDLTVEKILVLCSCNSPLKCSIQQYSIGCTEVAPSTSEYESSQLFQISHSLHFLNEPELLGSRCATNIVVGQRWLTFETCGIRNSYTPELFEYL